MPVVFAPKDGSPWVRRALLADPDVELIGAPIASLNSAEIPDDALIVIEAHVRTRPAARTRLILNPPRVPCRKPWSVRRRRSRASLPGRRPTPGCVFSPWTASSCSRPTASRPRARTKSLVRTRSSTVIADISSPGAQPARSSDSTSGTAIGRSRPRSCCSCATSSSWHECTAHRASPGLRAPESRCACASRPTSGSPGAGSRTDRRASVLARLGLAMVPEVARAGFYHLSWQGARPGSVLVAANLTSETESESRPQRPSSGGTTAPGHQRKEMDDAFHDFTWVLGALALAARRCWTFSG